MYHIYSVNIISSTIYVSQIILIIYTNISYILYLQPYILSLLSIYITMIYVQQYHTSPVYTSIHTVNLICL